MTDTIRVGVFLPTSKSQWGPGTDPRELIDFAARAERLGYDSVFVGDSIRVPIVDPLAMLSALAVVTERLTLGTGVLMPVLRRPVQTAHALASVDRLAGGRLTVGVGAGFPGTFGRPLHTLSEVSWARRFARLDETVTLWRQIWKADGHTSFHGELLHFDDIPPSIGPYRPGGPPLWLGGATPAALARTGRHYDGWFPYPPDPHDYRTGLADLRRTAVEAGRDPGTITPAVFVNVRTADSIESCRRSLDEFARVNYGLPLEDLEKIQAVAAGTAAQLADRLTPYIEAGARDLILRLGALTLREQLAQLERLVGLLPLLRPA
ncbi:monooxygenase [Streptomyces sp. MUSC 14]|uniref:LLM class flavin-dependent oxidoreductase n=1 Tax=Streptomyces sp. MUSC 14 TaxID=1354889 RepID=UPI0008F5B73D|nr:LLM class flavin-dependent oxidoreductase [Streptomyces sp. MUSC 14]OIJ90599.1 monooxygenase [Streptomyces sp. MUSC 14]